MKRHTELKLSNSSRKVLIDEEDYLLVCGFTWRVLRDKRTTTEYVATSKRNGKKIETIRLHRLVMNAAYGMDVHHINCDPYDNRKENLIEIPPNKHRGHSRDYRYEEPPAPF